MSCSSDNDCPCDTSGQACYVCGGEGRDRICKVSQENCKTEVTCQVDENDRGHSVLRERCVSFGSTLSLASSISSSSVLSLSSAVQSCPTRSCKRKRKCCKLVEITNSGRLGCPYRC